MITPTCPGPFLAEWPSLENYQTPEWYLDAKFGIFIHWGVYSLPAFGSEWYPRNMYRQGTPEFEHHVAVYGPQDRFGYKDFIPLFKAESYEPEAWAALFEEAGAKFVVPVAEHHDGFQMHASRLSKWNAVQMGPRRDLLGDLAAAVRRHGMVFGCSSHRAEHWWFMNGGREFPSDVQDPDYADFYGPAQPDPEGGRGRNIPSEAFMEDWLARCAELIDSYRPQLFYFDWWIEQPEFAPFLRRFLAYYYNRAAAWGQGVAVNYKNRAMPEKAAVYDVERGQLAAMRSRFWQTDTAAALNSWGHVEGMQYRSAQSILYDLIDIVSKNGSLLLNIGPRADGTIPEEDQDILRSLGSWLAVNGEAVYGSRPWTVFGEGPTKVKDGGFTDSIEKAFTREDFRFTQKPGALYITVLAEASGPVLIRSLASNLALDQREIASVELVGGGPVAWTRTERGLEAVLPEARPSRFASVLKAAWA